jgi:hypothetical protein
MKRLYPVSAGFLAMTIAVAARAEQGGVGHYAPGAFASFVDALPGQPGVAVFNYFTYYNGNANIVRELPIAGEVAVDVRVTTYADSLGGFWVTPLKILGGYFAPGVSVPFVRNNVSGNVVSPGSNTVRQSSSVDGLGDIEFWPVALSWSALNNDLHVNCLGGIYAPTGGFQKNRLANQGLGYWTFEPSLLVSYLGQKDGFEFTTFLGYDINTKNIKTDYQSGQFFHLDATVAQHLPFGKGLIGIGANGFYFKQTTGDSGSGATLGNFEEMTAGIGPVLSYTGQFGKTGLAAELKWLPQIDIQKTLKGDYIWFKVAAQF